MLVESVKITNQAGAAQPMRCTVWRRVAALRALGVMLSFVYGLIQSYAYLVTFIWALVKRAPRVVLPPQLCSLTRTEVSILTCRTVVPTLITL